MKKIISILSVFIFLSQCSEYKPIFSSSSLQFKISDYHITGNKRLGNKLYARLNNLSRSSKNNENLKPIEIFINAAKNKNSTSKDSSGKTIEYKITVIVEVKIKDFLSGENILKKKINSSLSYKVQDQYSDTLKLDEKTIQNLINNISQKILFDLSKNISLK